MKRKPKFNAATKSEQPASELPFLGVTLLDKTDSQCSFPHGGDNGEPILFCGQPKAEGDPSYCSFHHSVCWVKPLRRTYVPFVQFKGARAA